MKLRLLFAALTTLFFGGCFKAVSKPEGISSSKSIYSYSFTDINGKAVNLEQFKGKKILFVNTASKCGLTPQYEGLQALHEKHKDNLVIIGFPANDFLSQEPGSNDEIEEFCKLNYGVTFTLAEKSTVVGDDKNPIFKWLTDKTLNGWNTQEPQWNFHKYLVDEKGELIAVYPPQKKPAEIAELQ